MNGENFEKVVEQGYRLGFVTHGKPYIHNHLKFIIQYHMRSA